MRFPSTAVECHPPRGECRVVRCFLILQDYSRAVVRGITCGVADCEHADGPRYARHPDPESMLACACEVAVKKMPPGEALFTACTPKRVATPPFTKGTSDMKAT